MLIAQSRPPILLALLVLACSTVDPAVAEADDRSRFTVHLAGTAFSPTGDQVALGRLSSAGNEEQTTLAVTEDGAGVRLGLAYRLGRRLGVSISVSFESLETGYQRTTPGGTESDRVSGTFQTVAIGVDYHPLPDRRTDLRLSAFVAETKLDDVVFFAGSAGREKLAFDDDHGFGIGIGLDRPFRQDGRWVLTADLRYLFTILESETAGQDVDLDPLTIAVGVGYRF